DQGRRSVAVLGSTTASNLFGTTDPIGQTIRINRDLYRVVGVLQASGGRGGSDNGVYVPYTRLLNPAVPNQIQSVMAQVDDTSNLDSVSTEMQVLLEQRHHILPGAKDGFDVTQAIAQLQQ